MVKNDVRMSSNLQYTLFGTTISPPKMGNDRSPKGSNGPKLPSSKWHKKKTETTVKTVPNALNTARWMFRRINNN